MDEQRAYPRTKAGKEMYRLAEAVAVKLEPDGGGPFVDVCVLAVEMVRQTIIEIENEASEPPETEDRT